MASRQLAEMQASGKSHEQIAKATKDMAWAKEMYSNWLGLIGITLLEVLPLGVLVALVSAAILWRRQPPQMVVGM